MKIWVKFLLAALGAAAAAGLGLDSAHVIGMNPVESIATILVIAGVAVVGPLVDALQDRSAAAGLRWEQEIREALGGTVATVAALPGMDWTQIGASLFVVKREHRFWGPERLVRVIYEQFAYHTVSP